MFRPPLGDLCMFGLLQETPDIVLEAALKQVLNFKKCGTFCTEPAHVSEKKDRRGIGVAEFLKQVDPVKS